MKASQVFQRIKDEKMMAVIRKDTLEELVSVCEILQSEGLTLMEISLTSPFALEAIQAVKNRFPHILLGAGTVLCEADMEKALTAGADFLVSPSFHEGVVAECKRKGVLVITGVFTPTEMMLACEYGCPVVKIFPANTLGTNSIKAFQGPFPKLTFLPMGGIDRENAREWLKGGAVCLGIGGSLCNGSEAEVRSSVRYYKRVVSEFKKEMRYKAMNYKELQDKFDKEKWHDSILVGADTCGEYDFCVRCNKAEEYPCAKAMAKHKGKRVRLAQLLPRKD